VCHQQEGLAAQEKVDELTKEVKSLREENKTLSDNYNSERVSQSKWSFLLIPLMPPCLKSDACTCDTPIL